MRLRISLRKQNCTLPLNYQHLLQGFIYQSLPKDGEGAFYHDEGYHSGSRTYKMFVFSNLLGRNHVDTVSRTITFEEHFHFYFASEDENLVQELYAFLQNNQKIALGKEIVEVIGVDLQTNPYFRGVKEITVQTISPLVAYKTDNNYVTYYKPSSPEFEQLVIDNLARKQDALKVKDATRFRLVNVISEKKRKIHYKNTFYEAYNATLRIETNSETLSLLLNTGISAKGSAGFGMLEVFNDKKL